MVTKQFFWVILFWITKGSEPYGENSASLFRVCLPASFLIYLLYGNIPPLTPTHHTPYTNLISVTYGHLPVKLKTLTRLAKGFQDECELSGKNGMDLDLCRPGLVEISTFEAGIIMTSVTSPSLSPLPWPWPWPTADTLGIVRSLLGLPGEIFFIFMYWTTWLDSADKVSCDKHRSNCLEYF